MAQPLKQISPQEVASFAYDPVDARALVDAQTIVQDVRAQGEPALRKHALRLGDIADEAAPLVISKAELKAAFEKLPKNEQQVLQRTAQRIRVFAQSQRNSIGNFEQKIEGGFAGQDVSPMASAGCYAPGGRVRRGLSPLRHSLVCRLLTLLAGVRSTRCLRPCS